MAMSSTNDVKFTEDISENEANLNMERLRDINRLQNPRKKRPSDNPASQKERNTKRKLNSTRQMGRLTFYYNDEDEKLQLFNQIDSIKMLIGEGKVSQVSNMEVLNTVLDFYISRNGKSDETTRTRPIKDTYVASSSYHYSTFDNSLNEDMFLCTSSAVGNLTQTIQEHYMHCGCDVRIHNSTKMRFASKLKLVCSKGHKLEWYTSPYVEGGKLLVNLKAAHGYLSSGMLPSQFTKFSEGAGLGLIGERYLQDIQDSYENIVSDLATKSQENALKEEISLSVASSNDTVEGIGIMTDARHCWRRNARFSDVVCLGDNSHKVLCLETVSKEDDPVTQRHELIGVKRIYDHFDQQQVPILLHAHDNHASVTRFVVERGDTTNANDTWHMAKGITKSIKKITSGTKKTMGKVWYSDLDDKAGSIRTHIYWAMKNCDKRPEKLRQNIDNIIMHYKGCHKECHTSSRCRSDPHYEPQRKPIANLAAEQTLMSYLHSLPVYRRAELYASCKDTHYVESFNNAMLQYVDKRVVFGLNTYRMRVQLLDWNENVDRPITSRRFIESIKNQRAQLGCAVHKKKTFEFRDVLWLMWLEHFYGDQVQQ